MSSQPHLPNIGLGTWKLNGQECIQTIHRAWDLGYRHIDTADGYGNHREVGEAIKQYPRDQLFLTTKLAMDDLLPSKVQSAVPRFLDELQTDYIDLLLIHWPNPNINLVETVKKMVDLKNQGFIRFIGVSNFVRFHLDGLKPYHFPILTNQIEMHPYLQRKLLVEKCKKMGIKITAYRPLAKGAFEKDPVLQRIGKKHGKSPSQVALKWLIQQDMAVIPKASNPQHLKDNISIFDFNLDDQDVNEIEALDSGQRFCAPNGFPVYED